MNQNARENFFILDGTSLVYRAFYAIQNLKNSSGFPTNAIFGFIKILQKLIRDKKPDHLIIVLDAKGPTFRHIEYEEYKAHRKPMPDELVMQLPFIKEVVQAYGLPLFEISGFEADDVIGTLAQKAKEKFNVFIVSPDKDILQLVESSIEVIPNPSEELILNEEGVHKLYGIPAKKMTDFLGLVGDASDNIPGVQGIGPKTATLLLNEFDSLEKIFEESWTQKGRIKKESLIEHEKVAKFSKMLATIRLDVPIELPENKKPDLNREKLTELFQKFEFRDLLRECLPASTSFHWEKVEDSKKCESIFSRIEKEGEVSFALHTQDLLSSKQILGLAMTLSEEETYYFPLQKNSQIIFNLLQNPSIKKTGYDLKVSRQILEAQKKSLNGLSFDIMIACFLVNPSLHLESLKDIAAHFLSLSVPSDLDLTEESVSLISSAIFRLKNILKDMLIQSGQKDLFEEMEMPLVEVISDMETEGIPLHIPYLQAMSKELEKTLGLLIKDIHELSGEIFNINSPKELSKILFEKLKLPTLKKTKTGFSTNAEVLDSLAEKHEIIPKILEYRQLGKLKSTYIDALPLLVNSQTGRLHTTFSQTTAETGRLASTNPNLQNIPIRSSLGKKIREAFVAPPKTVLLSADYSQIELRILAHLSEDPGLIQAFERNEDIHRSTASAIFNIDPKEVSEAQRSKAKAINFGIVYGMGSFGLAKGLKISIKEAEDFIRYYYERFQNVKSFIQHTLQKAREQGYVTTLFNRRRYLPDMNSPNPQLRQMAERMAMNTPIQGTAADLIKLAMIRIHEDLKKHHLQSRLVLQIHDELILIVPHDELSQAETVLKEGMENIATLKVKLKVDIHSGKNWMEL